MNKIEMERIKDVRGNSWEDTTEYLLTCEDNPSREDYEDYLNKEWKSFPYNWSHLNIADDLKSATVWIAFDHCN